MTDASMIDSVTFAPLPSSRGKLPGHSRVGKPRFLSGYLWAVLFILLAPSAGADVSHGQAFRDWSVHCEVPRGLQAERCFIFQNVVRKQGDRLVHIGIGYLTPDGRPAAMVTLPLGIYLPAGIGLQIDDQEALRFGFERCDQTGCFGAVVLDEGMLEGLRSGKEARISFRDGERNEITSPISLRGFGAGFDALK